MSYLQLAREFDMLERPLEAVWAYELATKQSAADLDLYLDLVGVYLSSQDPGFAAAHRLSVQFVEAAAHRAFELLDEAEGRIGRHGDIEAWRLYLRERAAYEEVPDASYEEIASRTRALMAYYRLYIGSGGERYREEVRPLFEWVRHPDTERKRYLGSVLHSSALAQPPVR